MFEKLGGRKLVFGLITLGVGLVIGHIKGDIPPNVLSLLEMLFGSFVAGNSVGTIVGAVVSGKAVPESTDVVDSDLVSHIEEVKAANSTLAQSVSIIQQSLSLIIRRTGIDRMPDPTPPVS